jgi:uncharacterized membrane protein YraQ (UPF0718 family)
MRRGPIFYFNENTFSWCAGTGFTLNWPADTWHYFWLHFADAAPWLLVGALVGVALNRWIKTEWVERWMQSGHSPVLAATVAGALLPGCAMTTMPLASSLRKKGANIGTLTAFIMIAPILSPQTLVLNLAMLGWPMTLGRIVLPFFLSIALGLLINTLARRGVRGFTRSSNGASPASRTACGSVCGCHTQDKDCCEDDSRESFSVGLWTLLRELLPYFLIGLLVVSLLESLIPQATLARYIHSGFMACVLAAAAGIPLYVCDGGEIPLTLALLKLGAGPGPAFAFLLSSVGTCLPTIAMAGRIIGAAATALYVVAWLVLSIGGGLLMGIFLR